MTDAGRGTAADADESHDDGESNDRRVWLVERTYSDDEQNLIVLTYATPDGERDFRKERALTSFSDERATPVSLVVSADNLGTVSDAATRERYATEVDRMREKHDRGDQI